MQRCFKKLFDALLNKLPLPINIPGSATGCCSLVSFFLKESMYHSFTAAIHVLTFFLIDSVIYIKS
jgi:hypothetical protein